MKNFIYLVQGSAKLVVNYLHLLDRTNADAIFLTYDEPLDGAIFLPNSSWAEGRNKLLEVALSKKHYLYYIFCDDDIAFKAGGWDAFEQGLTSLNPLIAVPIVPRVEKRKRRIQSLKYQLFVRNDDQLMAFHQSVIADHILLPYQTQFDAYDWCAACEIQQILIQNFYYHGALQFNTINIRNTERGRHTASQNYQTQMHDWLKEQFNYRYKTNKLKK